LKIDNRTAPRFAIPHYTAKVNATVPAVGAIVVGHVLATWLAHETALAVFGAPKAARRSQGPMLVLMVGYTVLSLWILSQPIVEP
jgi:hypothetical protein